MNGETVVLFLSLTSTLVMMMLLLAVFKLFRANQKIAKEIGVEQEDLFSFNLSHPTFRILFYPILALSAGAMLFAVATLIEGSYEVTAYLFGIGLVSMAIAGYCITINSKPTQTTTTSPPKITQSPPDEQTIAKPPENKPEPPKTNETNAYSYCRYCGNRNESEATFCRNCGKKIIK